MSTEMKITNTTLSHVRKLAVAHMSQIGRGHGPDHILRVEKMALDFAAPDCNTGLVSIMALLHDADDYKFFPNSGPDMPNMTRIMDQAHIPQSMQSLVRQQLRLLGYSKRLAGKQPTEPEAQAVSDADMCDILGATGLVRLIEYGLDCGHPFFDPNDTPNQNLTAESYTAVTHETPCRHMFDKVLRLPGLMLTEDGRKEAEHRVRLNITFLRETFREQDARDWDRYLSDFLSNNKMEAFE